MAEVEEVFRSQCPRCKCWQDDYDGFGVLACGCGYCAHPSITNGVCGLCGAPDDLPDQPGPNNDQ